MTLGISAVPQPSVYVYYYPSKDFDEQCLITILYLLDLSPTSLVQNTQDLGVDNITFLKNVLHLLVSKMTPGSYKHFKISNESENKEILISLTRNKETIY